jgi:hypothetical protein
MVGPNSHRDESATDLDLRQYDSERIPFPKGAFGLVTSTHVVKHAPNPQGFISKLTRVTSGPIYAEVPCELTVRTKRSALQPSVETGHINLFTPESFPLLLRTSGLEVQRFELFDPLYGVLSFRKAPLKGRLMSTVQSMILGLRPILASWVFTYHRGALCHRAAVATQR